MKKFLWFIAALFFAPTASYADCSLAGVTSSIITAFPTQTVGAITPAILRNNLISDFTCVQSPLFFSAFTTKTVSNNAGLSALSTVDVANVIRNGFSTPGDSPQVLYIASGSVCSLNAGAGDGGSQVPSNNGKCWIASLNGDLDIRIWGADPSGTNFSTTAIQAAQAYAKSRTGLTVYGGVVYSPCGQFKLNATITSYDSPNVLFKGAGTDCTNWIRFSDYGPTLAIKGVANFINGGGIRDMTFIDSAAGSAGQMTTVTSPYHIMIDGISRVQLQNVTILEGGGIQLLATNIADVNNITESYTHAATGNRIPLNISSSANGSLSTKWGSDIFINHLDILAGDTSHFYAYDGLYVNSVDGLWLSNIHIQGTNNSDFHLARNTSDTLGNVYGQNIMLDIPQNHGFLIDGSQRVDRIKIEGAITAAGIATPNIGNGVLITGAGGVINGEFDFSIDGFGAYGWYSDATLTDTIIRPKAIRANNLLVSTYGSMSINLGVNISVVGGVLDGNNYAGTRTASTGLTIGQFVSHFSSVGTIVTNNTTYGYVLVSGAQDISLAGGSAIGNLTAPMSDGSGGVCKSFVGVNGVAISTSGC